MRRVIRHNVLVISTRELSLKGVTIVDSIKGIEWGKWDYVVFNSCKESDSETLTQLTAIRDFPKIKVVLIGAEIQTLWYYIFTGLDADIYEGLEYLEEQDIFEYLLDNFHNNKEMCVKNPTEGVESLGKFLTLFSTASSEEILETVNNKLWLSSLHEVVEYTHNSLIKTSDMGSEVLVLMSKTHEMVKTLEESQVNTMNQIVELQRIVKELTENVASPSSDTKKNAPTIFSTYRVPLAVKNVMYIRVISEIPYINSYLVAFQHYLKINKQLNSKILLMYRKSKVDMERFSHLQTLAPETVGLIDNNYDKVAITYEPTKAVLDSWFKGSNKTNLFIIIDYLKGDSMITGHNVKEYYTVSGMTDMRKLGKDKKERCFVALVGLAKNLRIPAITGYTSLKEKDKLSYYQKNCMESFERITNEFFGHGA